ncbi:MAG: peptidoglycan DD-metalloendopeptidase family protein [Clostridia bacterium]|nr:peptidoglycan DD-metalloendopeptidase family protein [Clostridia bacterium]
MTKNARRLFGRDGAKRRRLVLTRALCLLLCGVLVAAAAPAVYPAAVAVRAEEDSIDDLTQQKEELAAEQAALEARRNESAESLEEQEEQKAILEQQISVKTQEIAVNQQLVDDLESRIAEKEEAIAAQTAAAIKLDRQIEFQFALLQQRLRAIAKRSTFSSALQMLFCSRDYTDYLIGTKSAARLAQSDEALMEELENNLHSAKETAAKLEADKAALLEEQAKATALRDETAGDKQDLQVLYNEADALADALADQIDEYDESIAELEARQASMQSRIDDVMAQILVEEEARRAAEEERSRDDEDDEDDDDDGGGSYVSPTYQSGSMLWPAPGCTVITSSYKARWGRWHYGDDIACYGDAEGMPIVAAASGTVVYANRYDTWGDGYGLYLIIDHGYDDYGQRIMTLYAHCSYVDVSEGDYVDGGDYLGNIGNTGASDGAHLHFEVRVDGSAVDPVESGFLSTSGIDVLG